MINSFNFRETALDDRVRRSHDYVRVQTLIHGATTDPFEAVDEVVGGRVIEEEEVQGLDLSQYGEEDYDWEAST